MSRDNLQHWLNYQTDLIQNIVTRVPCCEKSSSITCSSVLTSNCISSKVSVIRGEEGLEKITKEVITLIASETCYISTDPNPRPPMADFDAIIWVRKFLLILNFGSKNLCNGCRTDHLGYSDKSSAMHSREGHQEVWHSCSITIRDNLQFWSLAACCFNLKA